ncbi:hypothetical protein [Nocardioides speluncae]|uniref:hypothetical protein n=1 Tax=Nocardioides speluncae TaxID=2670337 RepID=UPI000D69BE5F|nr:hypothetical protein [Nocardioides speluncae]
MLLGDRLIRCLAVFAVLAVPLMVLQRDATDPCGSAGACVREQWVAAGYAWVVVPVLAWLALRLVKVPRAVAHAVGGTVAATLVRYAARSAWFTEHPDLDPFATPATPWGVTLIAALIGGTVAGSLAGRIDGPPIRAWDLRGATALALATAVFVTGRWQDTRAHDPEVEAVARAEVTTYLPSFRGHTPTAVSGYRNGLVLTTETKTGKPAPPVVTLVPKPAGDLCDARIGSDDLPGGECWSEGGVTVRRYGRYRDVAVVRGNTLLYADRVDTKLLSVTDARDALRTAPEVPREKLLDLEGAD